MTGGQGSHGPALADKKSPARSPGPKLLALLVFQEKPAILVFKLISEKNFKVGHQFALFETLSGLGTAAAVATAFPPARS